VALGYLFAWDGAFIFQITLRESEAFFESFKCFFVRESEEALHPLTYGFEFRCNR
jgi:hypothetical protein